MLYGAIVEILSFILWVLIGVATGYLASQRGRDPIIWFVIGTLLGVFGLLLLFIMPSAADKKAGDFPANTEGEDVTLPALPPNAHSHDSYLIKEWFYLEGSQQKGPISYDALKQVWRDGKINDQSFVWSEGMPEWQRIQQLPELQNALLKSNLER